jgi:putative IMPACT (imprinted ancient) family translation regulator
VVVVTRYFGGTRLGTGGLVRAYGGVAAAALSKAILKTVYLKKDIICEFSYDMTPVVMNALEKFNGEITSSRYDKDVRVTISVRSARSAEFQAFLIERSSGNIKIRK